MQKAKLLLEDGTEFLGYSFGHDESISGEVVFTTGMVGYPETFTDPSYAGQILVMTYPLIGNYGVPTIEKLESSQIHLRGIIVSQYSLDYFHYQASSSLRQWLIEQKIAALCGIDTRALTQHLREKGVMLGKILISGDIPFDDPNKTNLVEQVTSKEVVELGKGNSTIIAVDCGMKKSLLSNLLRRFSKVTVVPYDHNFLDEKITGVFISNGPGDPSMCQKTIQHINESMELNVPIFGVCLGHQLLALASGGKTYKLRYGHRGQNQPCIDRNKQCFVTAQNHGYAVDAKSLSEEWKESFTNLNDQTNEGIIHTKKPWMSVQFHPEGNSGPADTNFLFDAFYRMVHRD